MVTSRLRRAPAPSGGRRARPPGDRPPCNDSLRSMPGVHRDSAQPWRPPAPGTRNARSSRSQPGAVMLAGGAGCDAASGAWARRSLLPPAVSRRWRPAGGDAVARLARGLRPRRAANAPASPAIRDSGERVAYRRARFRTLVLVRRLGRGTFRIRAFCESTSPRAVPATEICDASRPRNVPDTSVLRVDQPASRSRYGNL
jgi:hypothetical protein